MSLGTPAVPAPSRIRRRWLVLVAVVAAAVAALAVEGGREDAAAPPPPPPVCVMEAEPAPAPPPARPVPGAEAWADLERCLAKQRVGPGYPPRVTLAQVRGWVAEGDPVWLAEGDWWFPMSGEGEAQMPSGYYLAAPSCGGAIVN